MFKHLIAYEGLIGASLAVMQKEYLSDFLVFANDIRVTEGTRMRAPVDFAEETEWMDGLHKSKQRQNVFAVLKHIGEGESRTYQYVGHTGIHGMQFPNGVGSTGSLLGGLDNLKQGIGTEAKLLLLYHAFRVLGLRKLTSQVKAFNAQSLGHLIKTGYRIAGRFTDHEFHDGAYVDEILLEVFRDDWEILWAEYQATRKLPKLSSEQRELVTKETTITKK